VVTPGRHRFVALRGGRRSVPAALEVAQTPR
jgi:hypothetical protein